jgi:hypothetical protein
MYTRTTHRLKKHHGGIDRLNTRFLDFEGDLPPFAGSTIPDEFDVVTCNDFRKMTAESLVSTFVEDYYLERHWNRPELYAARFAKCRAVMSPDYSLLVGMPEAMMRWQVYRSRMMGYVFAKRGGRVIYTVTWAGRESFGFCFEGLPVGAHVAVSSTGAISEKSLAHFRMGYEAMQEAVKPGKILFQCSKRLRHFFEAENVVFIDSFFDKRREALKQESHGR